MVAREGSAPSISGCRPAVMLFHHRAVKARLANIGCLAWIRTKAVGVKTRYAAVTPRGNELVEPEVVATSPYPGKSRVPVCCGFDSLKLACRAEAQQAKAGARGRTCTCTDDVLDVVPLLWATRANGMEPPAGDAPAGFLYKRNPQAAAWRRGGRNPECCPRRSWLMMPA